MKDQIDSVTQKQADLAWNMLVELRLEIVASLRIRAQAIGFKITFISTGIAIIIAYRGEFRNELLLVPAFAAIFFDFLINSYSVSIKRLDYYTRVFLEPKVYNFAEWPKNEISWQEYIAKPESKQSYSMIGNLGFTVITMALAAVPLFYQSLGIKITILIAITLLFLFIIDVIIHRKPRQFTAEGE